MSHPEQREFVKRLAENFPDYFSNANVLEVGSLDTNGSIRDFFDNCNYIGVDLDEGPGVDLVGEGQELQFPENSFHTVISTECFEHNPYWKETFINMVRMSSGLVIFTAATTGRAEHGTSKSMPHASPFTIDRWNYYKNISKTDIEALPLNELFLYYQIEIDEVACDIYFWGFVREIQYFGLHNNSSLLRYLCKEQMRIENQALENIQLLHHDNSTQTSIDCPDKTVYSISVKTTAQKLIKYLKWRR